LVSAMKCRPASCLRTASRPWPARATFAAAAGVLLAACGPASAQQRTTATYDDWVVRCDLRAGSAPHKVCEMEQVAEVQGKGAPVSRVAVTREIAGHPLLLVVQVPVNVWVAAGVKVEIDNRDTGLLGAFSRCIPAGCFSDIDVKANQLKLLGTATKPGKIVYKDAAGRDVTIPLSLKGFAAAYDALPKS